MSLAKQLAKVNTGPGTAAVQQTDILHAVTVAVENGTSNTLNYTESCKEEAGVEAELGSVNVAAILGITSIIPSWILTASISHIISNIALVSQFDVASKLRRLLFLFNYFYYEIDCKVNVHIKVNS